ncbi:hypothetical protein ACRQTN_00300 [Pectobacterium brasiliense]|uniref:hypothetical protein n=1 Tax=Pectobacterium TaxID=122277 RepID=UPI001968E211|nr:hypothetical protein [Pectobacterium brasiliense]MBN3200323.1 hypothetical protein [Pectobacterium brasiliense]
MKLETIETADCNVISTTIKTDEIRMLFESIYDMDKKEYINNVALVIIDWIKFEAKLLVSNGPNQAHKEKKLTIENLEYFELIQKISYYNNELRLQGYSMNSGDWLEYQFTDANYRFEKI